MKKQMYRTLCGAVVAVLFFGIETMNARADTLQYTFTPTSGGSEWFSFETSSNPVPVQTYGDTSFLLVVDGQIDGQEAVHDLATFLTSGGLDFSASCGFEPAPTTCYEFEKTAEAVPTLFTGPTSSPTLLAGTFPAVFHITVTDPAGNSLYLGEEGFLTVRVTPEPSTLALLGTGLLGFAGVARRRLFGR